jgi:hypothetical protein
VSWYLPRSDVVEAKQLRVDNCEEIEVFVGANAGHCNQIHQGCLSFETAVSPLHVCINQYVIKHEIGALEVMDAETFTQQYTVIQRDPYGD